jgi:hypothetical protein
MTNPAESHALGTNCGVSILPGSIERLVELRSTGQPRAAVLTYHLRQQAVALSGN